LLRPLAATIDGRVFPYFLDPDRLSRSRYGVSALEVAVRSRDIVEKGVKRLEMAVKRIRVPPPEERLELEVLSFYVAALLAHHSGNRWVVSRLALAESERAHNELLKLPDELVAYVGRMAGIESMSFSPRAYAEPIAVVGFTPIYRVYGYSLKFIDYVEHSRRLLGDDAWKPVNLPVKRGLVFLDKQRAARLIKEALMEFIVRRVGEIGSSVTVLPEQFNMYLERIREAVASARRPSRGASGVRPPPGVIIEEAFPPCIADVYERAKRGEHLSHHERFAIATFLLNIGADVDTVVDVFRNMPDFKEKITRYQVEHLAGLRGSGKKYSTYSCEKMKTLGLCRADCGTRSPVQAYYRNLRRVSRDAPAGKAAATQQSRTDQQPSRGKDKS